VNVGLNLNGEEVANGTPPGNILPDLGRGNVHESYLANIDRPVLRVAKAGYLVIEPVAIRDGGVEHVVDLSESIPGSRHDHKVTEREEIAISVPSGKGEEGIQAHDEIEECILPELAEKLG
jgi:hypothetical protein